MNRLLCFTMALALAAAASAEQFSFSYEANDFPENEGWVRHTRGPADQSIRRVGDGIFSLDTRASLLIADFYSVTDPRLEPGLDELLRVTWRMQTLETDTFGSISDVVVAITNSSREYAEFFLAPDFVSEQGEAPPGKPEHFYPFEPGVFHTYSFLTSDMQTYELFVDGEFAFGGDFTGWSWRPGPRLAFGDVIVGRSSLSEWDFVRIAVIPEPAPRMWLVAIGVLWTHKRRKQGGMTCEA